MSLPIVKLINKVTKTYTYHFGNREYEFRQGATESVPVALAERLKKIVNRSGECMFDVKDLPQIIIPGDRKMGQCSLFS